jgi:hypothetical protein
VLRGDGFTAEIAEDAEMNLNELGLRRLVDKRDEIDSASAKEGFWPSKPRIWPLAGHGL